jgi:hypothetical protein
LLILIQIFHPIAERLLEHCDAAIRVGGPSQGADLMVKVAQQRGLSGRYILDRA